MLEPEIIEPLQKFLLDNEVQERLVCRHSLSTE